MTPSQRDEDMKAFTEWETTGSCGMSDVWLAALAWERERVKREEPLVRELINALCDAHDHLICFSPPPKSDNLIKHITKLIRQADDVWPPPTSETPHRPEPRLKDDEAEKELEFFKSGNPSLVAKTKEEWFLVGFRTGRKKEK